MAKAFPKSEFYGFDLHPASIEAANRAETPFNMILEARP
jgi:hypothetical protein